MRPTIQLWLLVLVPHSAPGGSWLGSPNLLAKHLPYSFLPKFAQPSDLPCNVVSTHCSKLPNLLLVI